MASVLIVEDENSLRETLTRFLAHEGYEVRAAASGREAFDVGISSAPDILVTDWVLKNHIHGLHVSEALRAVNPDLRTILITGFSSQDLLSESDRCGVLQLLEKPFNLTDLQEAVENAAHTTTTPGRSASVAVVEIDNEGKLHFVSKRARQMFDHTTGGRDASQLQDVIGADALALVDAAQQDWESASIDLATGESFETETWIVRSRRLTGGAGYLVVLLDEQERPLSNDPRVRILLDQQGSSRSILPDYGPVIVVENDGSLRRLLVSQIERLGALCYPTNDFPRALKLLEAEPRAATVLIDFELAGANIRHSIRAVHDVRPEALVIGTGGSGSEEDLLAVGVHRVLSKPWRITDLLDAMSR
ncbi:MAG: response regulator [Myxococcota bacterium]|nr:response regulator [Myxococcota bacterium]